MDNAKVLLPREVDIDKCIALNASFVSARLDLEKLGRLAESVVRIEGDVLATVNFERDLNSMRLVKGTAEADVVLICQRCNQEMVQHLELEFELTPDFKRAQACNLTNKYDFIELNEDGKIDLYDLIEDGLILEIPAFPKHDENATDCAMPGSDWSYGELPQEQADNPFAALAALKGNLNK